MYICSLLKLFVIFSLLMGLTNFNQEKQQVEDSRRREKKLSASLFLKTKEALIQCSSLKKYVCIIRPICD